MVFFDYHPQIKRLLNHFQVRYPGQIIWAHRVLTRKDLNKNLSNNCHFFEGDIRIKNKTPVLSHHPINQKQRYLSLKFWSEKLTEKGRGIKLDFKESGALKDSLFLIQRLKTLSYLVILNADVINQSGTKKSGFNPHFFIKTCRQYFPYAILSLGFIPSQRGKNNLSLSSIKEMISLAKNNQPAIVAFPANWVNKRLINLFIRNRILLTLWSNQDNPLNILWWKENYRGMIKYAPYAFMDFPEAPWFSSLCQQEDSNL